jgi:hypothetical protein
MPEEKKKPIDRWLGLGATAVAIGLYLIPNKTPGVIIACLAAMFILLIHPVWNFWWIDKSRVRQSVACMGLIGALIMLGIIVWPSSVELRTEQKQVYPKNSTAEQRKQQLPEQKKTSKPDSSELLLKALQNKGILGKEDVQYGKNGRLTGLGTKIPGVEETITLNKPTVTVQPQKESPPDVALRFVFPKFPALVIENLSGSVAHSIKWTVLLFNMDLPDENKILPIPTETFDWLRGHGESAPLGLFNSSLVSPLLKDSNRLFGSATVDCPTCARGRTYVVYIVWGHGGWFSELEKEKRGGFLYPSNKDSLEQFFKALEAAAPENKRLPIQER